jgi:hypothetical protein
VTNPVTKLRTDDADEVPLERLEARICSLAGRLAASTCEWLRLIAEFDRRKGWAQWGVVSCAHWLSWSCSVAVGAAREYVRVATALVGLPLLDAAFAAGRLSYSKVRALTRVADRIDEQTLLDQGLVHTASQLERVVRGYRKAEGIGREQRRRRRARWFWDEDGMLVVSARLTSDEGAVVVAALQQAQQEVFVSSGRAPPPAFLRQMPMNPTVMTVTRSAQRTLWWRWLGPRWPPGRWTAPGMINTWWCCMRMSVYLQTHLNRRRTSQVLQEGCCASSRTGQGWIDPPPSGSRATRRWSRCFTRPNRESC